MSLRNRLVKNKHSDGNVELTELEGTPKINRIDPTRGATGTKAFIYGKNLDGARIFFGSMEARIIVTGSEALTVEVPSSYGPQMIIARNLLGEGSSLESFTVIELTSFTFRGDAVGIEEDL